MRGSILLVVLWALFLLATLAVALGAYVRPQIELARRLLNRALTYNLAKAAVKRGILEVKKDAALSYNALNGPWSSNEEAFKEAGLGEGFFSVISFSGDTPTRYGLVDEERKINVNHASYDTLNNIFKTAGGASAHEARTIADSIIDWRDEDDDDREDGAEDAYYSNLNAPYPCRNAEFQVLEELLLVKGVSKEIFDKAKDRITIYSGKAVNINTADALVLQAAGLDSALVETIIRFRSGPDGEEGTADDNAFKEAGSIAATLNDWQKLASEELSQLNKVYGQGLLCVRSENFSGLCFGMPQAKKTLFKINFVFNRKENKLVYWKQD